MLYPVSHKVNKTASADEAKLCYSFVILACNVKQIYTESVYDKATAGGFTWSEHLKKTFLVQKSFVLIIH